MLILVCWIRLLSLGNMLSNLYNFCGREDCWMLMSQLSNVFPDLLDHRSLHFEAKFDKLRSVEMTQFRHAGLDACKSQHESLIRVLPKSERLSLVSVNIDVMTVVTSHVTEVWACYCCVTILRRKTSQSRLLGPGCFRFEAAGACCPPVRPERPALEDGPVTEAGLSLSSELSSLSAADHTGAGVSLVSGSVTWYYDSETAHSALCWHPWRYMGPVCSTHLSILRLTLTLRQTSFTPFSW